MSVRKPRSKPGDVTPEEERASRALVRGALGELHEEMRPPGDGGEPVFASPWESRAFATAVALHQSGAFRWPEFQQELIATIDDWELEGDSEWSYYRCWMAALERLLEDKRLVAPADLGRRTDEILLISNHHH